MRKSSKYIVNERVSKVAEQLIEGQGRKCIILYGTEEWGVSERQIDKYIAKARDLIQKENSKNIDFELSKALRRNEYLYRKSIEAKDYKLVLLVNRELTQLQGLYKIKVEHSGNIEFVSNIPD